MPPPKWILSGAEIKRVTGPSSEESESFSSVRLQAQVATSPACREGG